MALIPCKNCGKTISSSAKQCPHCKTELLKSQINTNITSNDFDINNFAKNSLKIFENNEIKAKLFFLFISTVVACVSSSGTSTITSIISLILLALLIAELISAFRSNSNFAILLIIIIFYFLSLHIVFSYSNIVDLTAKESFTFTNTFINLDDFISNYNGSSLVERASYNNLMRKLKDKGLVTTKKFESID